MQIFPRRKIWLRLSVLAACTLTVTILAIRAGTQARWLEFASWAASGLIAYLFLRRYFRRRRIAEDPLDEKSCTILQEKVSFYAKLNADEKRRYETDIAIFLSERKITGIDGVKITDQISLLVAAAAIRLIFGHPDWEYPDFGEILIYPGGFKTDGSYSTHTAGDAFSAAGQVHSQGTVILSLPHLMRSFDLDNDGFNVGYHEFAHVLDGIPRPDGVPSELKIPAYAPWANVMQKEFEKVHRGRSFLRRYAGTNPAEFFACAVEAFFEKPDQMKKKAPDLYQQLSEFFNQKPDSRESSRL